MAKTTAKQRAAAVQMHNQGIGIERIADFYGVKPDTVRGWISPDFAASQAKRYAKRTIIRRRSGVKA